MGPSVYNDGIAGYPESVFDSLKNSSYVLDHKRALNIKGLSTNCVYYEAYKILSERSKSSNNKQEAAEYSRKASFLKADILRYLYDAKNHKLYYLIDSNGNVDKSQETLGISFAVLFGILNKEEALLLTQNIVVSQYGITSIYPDLSDILKTNQEGTIILFGLL